MTTSQSVFSDIARDPLHPAPIYRDEQVIVLRDINPKAPSPALDLASAESR